MIMSLYDNAHPPENSSQVGPGGARRAPSLPPSLSNQTLSFMAAIGEGLDKVCSHYATKIRSRHVQIIVCAQEL